MTKAYELNSQPQNAPEIITAADGKTKLYRYNIEAVIYARDNDEAQHRLNSANIYLDAGRIIETPYRRKKGTRTTTVNIPAQRPLHQIHDEIRRVWKHVSPDAEPYLYALRYLATASDHYGYDTASEIIIKFIGNAKGWRGDDARRIKAELREHL